MLPKKKSCRNIATACLKERQRQRHRERHVQRENNDEKATRREQTNARDIIVLRMLVVSYVASMPTMINALSCISRLVVNGSDMLITNTSIHSFHELSALEKHSRTGMYKQWIQGPRTRDPRGPAGPNFSSNFAGTCMLHITFVNHLYYQ